MEQKNEIIANTYKEYSQRVYAYIHCRINNDDEATDIMQDVFVRLLDCDVVCADTVRSLIFTIANNLVIDHIRRHYKRQEVYSYIYDMNTRKSASRPDDDMAVRDIEALERSFISRLSPATARVYEMSRIQDMTIDEIADELSLSKRTVECHQFKSRKYVREQMRLAL